MKLIEHYLTQNACYRAGRAFRPKGIMVHSLGVAQPDVNVFLRTWNTPDLSPAKCVHAFVTPDGVYQALPWDMRGWHAGKRAGNDLYIGFEICEPAGHTYRGGTMIGYNASKNAAYFAAAYQNAVELTAMLCGRFGLDPLADGAVICHAEGHRRNIASNHADVMHWFPKHGKSMDTFRADVAARMKGEEEVTQDQFNQMMATYQAQQAAREPSDWSAEARAWAEQCGIIKGDAAGRMQYKAPCTREQMVVFLKRLGEQQQAKQ